MAHILKSLGGRYSNRKVKIVERVRFGAGSILAAVAGNFAVLLLGQVLQGAGRKGEVDLFPRLWPCLCVPPWGVPESYPQRGAPGIPFTSRFNLIHGRNE